MDTKQQAVFLWRQSKEQSHSKVTGSLAPKFRDSERGIHRTATCYRFLCMLPFVYGTCFMYGHSLPADTLFSIHFFQEHEQTKDSIRFDSIPVLLTPLLSHRKILQKVIYHL